MSETAVIAQESSLQAGATRPTLGEYELLHEIASGGMATVYLARKRGAETREDLFAIKRCHPHLRRDPAFVTMFLDEAGLAAKIRHPNVVATLEVSDIDALYFVMQYIEGMSLAEWISGCVHRRIDEAVLLRVIIDGLAGLHAAHELRDDAGKSLRLVHRDVSPQNLLVGVDGVTRIADFGIAKAESRATRTRTGQVKGKTGYMPPEQILGEKIDRRADVYAAGVVLWEALVGRRLFESDSDAATINQVLNGEIPAPSQVADVSPSLDVVVLRALSFEPDARYATAVDFIRALESLELPIASHHTVGEAVSDACKGHVQRLRDAVLRQSCVEIASAPVSVEGGITPSAAKPMRIVLGWLAAGLFGLVLLLAAIWFSSARTKPSRGGLVEPSVATANSEPPRLDGSAPALAATSPPETLAAQSRRAVRAPVVKQQSVPTRPQAPSQTGSEPTPPPRSEAPVPIAPSSRPRSRPSEFRPADL